MFYSWLTCILLLLYQSDLEQEQLLVDVEMDRERCDSFEALAKNIGDLKEMMHCLQQQVVHDADTVQRIDTHVENAALDISIGRKMLEQVGYDFGVLWSSRRSNHLSEKSWTHKYCLIIWAACFI